MKVRAIRYAGKADVYNMEVDDTHDFAVNGGVVVHNCYDMCRYVCMKNPIAPRPKAIGKIKPYDPLSTDDMPDYDKYEFYRKY